MPGRSLMRWGRSAQGALAGLAWPILGVAWVAVFALGLAGFAIEAGKQPPSTEWASDPSTWAYLALQLFTLESGAVVEQPGPLLNAARFLAPVVAAWTVLRSLATILQQSRRAYRLRWSRRHIVVCGLGHRGWRLARYLFEQGARVVAIERDPTNPHIAEFQRRGGLVVIGDASETETLLQARVFKARHVVTVCGDDGANAGVAVQVARAVTTEAGHTLSSAAIGVHAHVEDPTLCAMLRAYETRMESDPKRANLSFFNVYDRAAQRLLDQYRPFVRRSATAPPRALIVGLGPLGQRVTTHLGRYWHAVADRGTLKAQIVAMAPGADRTLAALQARYSVLSQVCQLDGKDAPIDDASLISLVRGLIERREAPFDQVYVCLEDEGRGLAAGLTLLKHVPGEQTLVVVAVATNEGGVAHLVSGAHVPAAASRLRAFGVLDLGCTPALLLGGTIEIMAQAIHERYRSQRRADGSLTPGDPALAPWESLVESLKESNLAQARDIQTKLGAIGYEIEPLEDWAQDGSEIQFEPQQIEDLARHEHARFVAERTAAGWTYGKERDIVRRTNPTLVGWDILPDHERAKDYDAVRQIPYTLARAGLMMRPSAGRAPAALPEAAPPIRPTDAP